MPDLPEIERLVLELPAADRARLASHLLQSLPDDAADEAEDEDDGTAEALRRSAELEADPASAVPLERFLKTLKERRR